MINKRFFLYYPIVRNTFLKLIILFGYILDLKTSFKVDFVFGLLVVAISNIKITLPGVY